MMKKRTSVIGRVTSWLLVSVFGVLSAVSPVGAQIQYSSLPSPGEMVTLSVAHRAFVMAGLTLDSGDPFKIKFLFAGGDAPLQGQEQKDAVIQAIKYFLASLTVADKDLWVNLSPQEQEPMISQALAQTEMGRDMLAQDYLLKQLAASLLYPMNDLGRKFWDGVYAQAQAKFGTTKIPVSTFNKVWVVPDVAEIYEDGATAYLVNVHLKVMLEEDYLAKEGAGPASKEAAKGAVDPKDVRALSSQMMKEIVLPAIEKEVNEGKNFAPLRQIVHAMVLGAWFKTVLRESILGRLYADQGKVAGVDQKDPADNEKIYQQYVSALQKGVFNFVKDEMDPATKKSYQRKYFSGGISLTTIPFVSSAAGQSLSPVSRFADSPAKGLDRLASSAVKPGISLQVLTPEAAGQKMGRVDRRKLIEVRTELTPVNKIAGGQVETGAQSGIQALRLKMEERGQILQGQANQGLQMGEETMNMNLTAHIAVNNVLGRILVPVGDTQTIDPQIVDQFRQWEQVARSFRKEFSLSPKDKLIYPKLRTDYPELAGIVEATVKRVTGAAFLDAGLVDQLKSLDASIQELEFTRTAMEEALGRPVIPGGIDLDPVNLQMKIKRDGKGVPLPARDQDFTGIAFDGLYPQVLEIKPAG